MTIFLNGRFVREEKAAVSVFDRGFLYGDGVFETLRVTNGKPFRWAEHWTRLQAGTTFLKIRLPFSSDALLDATARLISKNKMAEAVLRLTASRGVGPRGYSPKGADCPTVVITLQAAPQSATQDMPRWRLVTSTFRLPVNEPLAQFKTCNKLPQVLARAEAADAGADEALLSNTDGYLVEGSSSNLFWLQDNQVCTAPLATGVLPGVTRGAVLELCERLGIPVRQTHVSARELLESQGVFVTLSTIGVAEAESLDGKPLRKSPLVRSLHTAYAHLLDLAS
jgi:aminodeoxychorismate lyase